MKQQVFYIHGGSAWSKYSNFLEHLRTAPIEPHGERPKRWADSLAEDLGDNFEVFSPTMPNKYNSKYGEWKIWFERHFEFLRDDVILIGWSQGGMFLVKYLIENDMPVRIKALFLIAAPFESVTFDAEDGGDFVFETGRTAVVGEKVPKIIIFHSKDDHVVPYEHALQFQKALPSSELVTFENKNHFLVEKLPELIGRIRTLT